MTLASLIVSPRCSEIGAGSVRASSIFTRVSKSSPANVEKTPTSPLPMLASWPRSDDTWVESSWPVVFSLIGGKPFSILAELPCCRPAPTTLADNPPASARVTRVERASAPSPSPATGNALPHSVHNHNAREPHKENHNILHYAFPFDRATHSGQNNIPGTRRGITRRGLCSCGGTQAGRVPTIA